MKRVLHIVGGMNRAGAETMLMNLYRKIDKSKYQFDFVYFKDSKCDYDEEIIELGGRIFRINSTNAILRTLNLIKLIKKEKPFHAVHAHMLFSNGVHVLAAYLAKVDMRISHSHNTSDLNSKTISGRLYQNVSRRLIVMFSTHFIACGEAAGEFLFPNNDQVQYLLNAIDVEEFCNNRVVNRNFLKKELNLDDSTTVITQIGRIAPVKNHEFTISFAEYLVKNGHKFVVNIVGSGPLEKGLMKLVEEKELCNVVNFLGIRSDIPNILAGTDLMIMPSFHEGFPVVLVESQASGVPSLISNNISSEVDMGLKLVAFSGLNDEFSTWETKLYDILQRKHVDAVKRLEVLSSKGFNINNSVKKLECIYG
ncbi:glycosyltransferase [Algibacter lectus]|uniref:Glycosyltransferase EpsF n=1 Tax=Algibacter lectus TaxID=221126 RepID=A0A4R8MCX6_9FLAO|nr:glycosyltransferase [Algibacter lectus]MWW23656.1 glycosyltransferase [Algibacter lectus]TDY63663.1 glycosyltransferase EpsF [Algibacter lectus]